jgi:serine/threonine protein kinase
VLSEDFPAHLAGFRTGSLVAGYRLEAPVGAGGMALVFRARDQRLGRLVALKILAPAIAADSAFRHRFIAESRAAAAVDDPHIIPIYEAGEADGVLFIAMRLVQGGDLRLVVHREGMLAPGRAAAFISPVASALDAAHAVGLVHRDVKPANILVDARPGWPDHVYLSDFGVSKGAMMSVSLTAAGQFVGTPDYSAPEQIEGRAVDGRTDQYALACVSYQLLTGAPPFERDQAMAVLLAHLSEPPPSLGSRRPDLPEAAGRVLARALAKAPDKRFGSCRAFAAALREALGLAPDSAPVPGHPLTEITSQPEFPGEAGAEKAAPAEPAGVTTLDSVPGGSSGAVDLPPAAIVIGPAQAAPHPEAMSPTAKAVEEDGVPADAGPVTVTSQSAGMRGMPGESGRPTGELRPTTTHADRPASMADGQSASQAARYDQSFVDAAERTRRPRRATVWIRQHRLAATGLAGAVLAVAVVVPYALAGSLRSVGPRSSVSSSSNSSVGALVDLPASDATSVVFNPYGGTLAVGGKNGRTYVWNIAARKVTTTITDPDSKGINSIAFDLDGSTLAAADSNGHAYVWNVPTGLGITTITDPHSEGVNSVAFNPDYEELATADGNGTFYFWNLSTGKEYGTDYPTGGVAVGLSVAFSPDGRAWALLSRGDTAYVLPKTGTGNLIPLTDPGRGLVNCIAYSMDGATLATADSNGSVYLWNIAAGKVTAILHDPGSEGVNAVAFDPDGGMLAATDGSGRTYLWHIS